MRQRFARFMMGRYGMDELSRAFLIPIIFCLFASMFVNNRIFTIATYVCIVLMYYRILSRNIPKRREENLKYLDFRYNLKREITKRRERFNQRKIYRFYHCPSCRQTVRVPKGHGKICITCPKCRTEFIKKS
ncbi:MAG: hypothetical protein K6F37_01250 [Lachnospiraceae bacterium]|nr:hypothetical protein [Lachnospiraceae bacterium]